MNRYLLKFEKTSHLRYTSHLDLLRMFRRAFKRAGIELVYSKGFNPHPKMSFAQPLSLGYTGTGEYLEIETTIPYNGDFLVSLVNSTLPFGVKIINCTLISNPGKSIASTVKYALYEASLPDDHDLPSRDQIDDYLNSDTIIVSKLVRKRKETIDIDIKPMIVRLSLGKNDEDKPSILMNIHAGSESNLNPELLLQSLFDFCKIPLEKYAPRIKRIELYSKDGQALG